MMIYKVREDFNSYRLGETIEISCVCRNMIFSNEESGYSIYICSIDNANGANFKMSGVFEEELESGQSYQVKGEVAEFKGQRQLKAKEVYPCLPKKETGIISYLRLLEGLDKRANDLYSFFKEDSIKVLIENPLLVSSTIQGIGKKSVLKWQEQLMKMKNMESIYIGLLDLGIKVKSAKKLIGVYGEKTLDKIKENPYSLIRDIDGYGFNKCDKLALEVMGYKPDNINRVRAGAVHALENYQNFGHCFSPKILLLPMIKELLNVTLSYKEMCDILYNPVNDGKKQVFYEKYGTTYPVDTNKLRLCMNDYRNEMFTSNKNKHLYTLFELNSREIENIIESMIKDNHLIEENEYLYLPEIYEAEIMIADKIKKLTKYKIKYKREFVEEVLDELLYEKGYELEILQREACILFNMYEYGLFILGGGAGTGKTFVLNIALEVEEILKEQYSGVKNTVTLVAPTGKASKVASIATGRKCSTIHRELVGRTNSLSAQTVVCDESSMVDVLLAKQFFKSIGDYAKVILIGDTGQIPSIGAGNVLNDLIETGVVKSVFLQVPKRQEGLSGLTKTANRVLNNQMIVSTTETKDFYFLERNTINGLRETVLESVRRILKFPKYTLDDVQVLVPQKTGTLGVNLLNYLMQDEFNTTICKTKVLKRTFEAKLTETSKAQSFKLYIKKNDKVMHIKNAHKRVLYKKDSYGKYTAIADNEGVFNGECGIVEDVLIVRGIIRVIVKYEDYYVFYDDGVDELELAYAMTIHKSQGSAYKATVVLVSNLHKHMWSNNLLYTALTRAREFGVVVGEKEVVNTAIHNHDVAERFTSLSKRVLEEV